MYFGNMFDPRQPPRATPLRPPEPKKPSRPTHQIATDKSKDERKKKDRKKVKKSTQQAK